MKNLFLFALSLSFLAACNSAVGRVFGTSKTPHEVYAKKADDSPELKQWKEISRLSLLSSQTIQLPYQQVGFFPAGKSRALSLTFNATRGEHIEFSLLNANSGNTVLYADVFKKNGEEFSPVLSAEENSNVFGFDAEETGEYILRLQPRFDESMQYNLAITPSPSLGFPVAGKAKVGGVWGDSRDNGSRKHEGIDIFAPKLTPAIAATDGYITSVKDGGLGGKTVNLKVEGRNLSLYYAHLDKQLVAEGDRVKKGDTLGLVGNTGNAKGMSPHLHFGIYTYGGAIDPLPFVNRDIKKAASVAARNLNTTLKLIQTVKNGANQTIPVNTVLIPLAVRQDSYIVELPDGSYISTPFKSVKETAYSGSPEKSTTGR